MPMDRLAALERRMNAVEQAQAVSVERDRAGAEQMDRMERKLTTVATVVTRWGGVAVGVSGLSAAVLIVIEVVKALK